MTDPESSNTPQNSPSDPQSNGSSDPLPPHRQPSNWQFRTLLKQVREKRQFSIEEASQCLPGISLKRLKEWELGRKTPLSSIQTFVIWKLNTSPRPRPQAARTQHNDRGSVLAAGLPAAAFVTTALATLIYHFSQPAMPVTLAGYIARSAPNRFLEKVAPEDFEDYATQLKATLLTQFDAETRAKIFGEHASIVEPLLAE